MIWVLSGSGGEIQADEDTRNRRGRVHRVACG